MITWAVPDNVGFAVSNREGGVSLPPFDSLNLGLHVDDNPEAVRENRRRVQHHFAMPAAPSWLDQVHSTKVVQLPLTASCQADASYTRCAGQVCVVMTSDCLPVLLCNRQGTEVAAIHAGWRGLCQGIIENTLGHFSAPAEEIMALTGPAIGPTAFEVGPEVREAFMAYSPAAAQAFIPAAPGKYMANLEQLAVQRLNHAGVTDIHCTSLCTYTLSDKYFSYRKSPVTGRFASFIWLKS